MVLSFGVSESVVGISQGEETPGGRRGEDETAGSTPAQASRLQACDDLKAAVAGEMNERGRFFAFWFGRLRRVLGLSAPPDFQ